MRHLERNLNKINRLLHLNYEVEKVYLEAYENVIDEDLKVFFRNTGFLRNEFGRVLRREINKLGGTPIHFDKLSDTLNSFLMKFETNLGTENESELLDQVCKIKKLSIDAYNGLLQETNLSLSICKALVGQRDEIQKTLYTIKAEEQLVA